MHYKYLNRNKSDNLKGATKLLFFIFFLTLHIKNASKINVNFTLAPMHAPNPFTVSTIQKKCSIVINIQILIPKVARDKNDLSYFEFFIIRIKIIINHSLIMRDND